VFLSEIGRCYPDLLTLQIFNYSDVDDDDDELQIQSHSEGLIALFEGCRKLKSLYISNSTLSETALIRAFECCRDIRTAGLWNMFLPTAALLSLSINCQQLDSLSLHNIYESKEHLLELSEQCSFRSIRSVRIAKTSICDRFLMELVKKSPLLKELDIDSCESITDVGMYHIATYCRNLENLRLSHLPRVFCSEYLIEILINNPKIRKYNLRFYRNPSSDSFIFVHNPNDEDDNGSEEFTAELQALLNSRA
jgi:hypothetical protein